MLLAALEKVNKPVNVCKQKINDTATIVNILRKYRLPWINPKLSWRQAFTRQDLVIAGSLDGWLLAVAFCGQTSLLAW